MIVLDKQMAHRAENHSIEFRQYLYFGIIIAKRICIADHCCRGRNIQVIP